MASTVTRRPLPALVALVALLLLTGLVWWRVLNRSGASGHQATPCPTITPAVRLPARSTVTVAVYNATTHAGIASKARQSLLADGFAVPSPAANASKKELNKITSTAQIRYGPAGRAGAMLLRYYFPGATMVATRTTSKTVAVALGSKYRAVASSASVAAALERDKTVAGTPTVGPSPAATC